MFLYSNVSFTLNSIHFHCFLALFFLSLSKNVKDAAFLLKHRFYATFTHCFLALFFLSLSKNVKDAAFLLKRRFYAAFTQTCVKAVETQVLRSFYADLRKSCRNTGFTQVCIKAACKSFAKAGGIGTCVIAAFPQLLLIMTIFTKLCVKAS